MSTCGVLAPKVLLSGGKPSNGSIGKGLSLSRDGSHFPFQSSHYGPQDLLACSHITAGGNVIFVFDMNSMQLVQTLHGHEAMVTAVAWRPPPASYLVHGLFLISGDADGVLCYWDVTEGVALSRVQVPCRQPIHALSMITSEYILAITSGFTSYAFSVYLTAADTSPSASLPLDIPEGGLTVPPRFCVSKLSHCGTSAIVLGDRIRVLTHLHLPAREAAAPAKARDLIYDSEDGAATVVDAFFSEANEEILYFATRSSVGCYDWRFGVIINEQLLWLRDGAQFIRIFPSSPSEMPTSAASSGSQTALPLLYSFDSDQRLTAWFTVRADRFASVSTDIRGVRMPSKAVANILQSDSDSTAFAVLFEDLSLCKWRFCISSRRWRMTHCCASPLQRPVCVCRLGSSMQMCFGLENGHVVVLDAMFNKALRRMNVVYSGGTRLVGMCTHKHDDLVWVVSCRPVDGKSHHQIALLNVQSGEVVQQLRKPNSAAGEVTGMKGVSMDRSYMYLLIVFWDGTFEVWNVEDSRLIHKHAGLGIANVSWAPISMRRCVSGLQGSPQLLSLLFSEGTMSLWSVYKDRVIASRDAVPLLSPGACAGGGVLCECVGDHLVFIDSSNSATALECRGSLFATVKLRDIPEAAGRAKCIAAPRPARLYGSSALSSDAMPADSGGGTPYVCISFESGAVGVWNAKSGQRIGYKPNAVVGGSGAAALVLWLGEHVVVVSPSGTAAIFDKTLTTANSSFHVRALRRPIQNAAFLLPSHRTFLQSSMEVASSPQREIIASPSPPSHLVQDVDPSRKPCRGPFGQVIREEVQTLREELQLYRDTMVPRDVDRRIAQCQARRGIMIMEVGYWTARFFGQMEKQRFWAQAYRSLMGVATSAAATGGEPDTVMDSETGEMPFLCPDAFSAAVGSTAQVRLNRRALALGREKALQSNREHNVDDSAARLLLARELILLREPTRAIDTLLECSNESPRYAALSTLAVAISASAAMAASTPTGTMSALFQTTSKRAAAMLLASGDVDAAVEKYILCREYHEAALALQSKGRWHEAAMLSRLSAGLEKEREDILRRWAQHSSLAGHTMSAAQMYLSVGMLEEALKVLGDDANCTDVAGVLALAIESLLDVNVSSALNRPSSAKTTLLGTMQHVLSDYASVLHAVGNVWSEGAVFDQIALLKKRNA